MEPFTAQFLSHRFFRTIASAFWLCCEAEGNNNKVGKGYVEEEFGKVPGYYDIND